MTELLAQEGGLLSLPVRLASAVVAGLCLILGGLLLAWRPGAPEVANLFFMLGWLAVTGPVLLGAIRGLRYAGEALNPYYLDLFVALVLVACLSGGRLVTGSVVAMILIFGQILEERSVRGIREVIEALGKLSRLHARRVRDGVETAVEAEAVEPGDLVRIWPGERLPTDGVVVRGSSVIDQSTITGESLPKDVGPGDEVFAGTMNLSGQLEIETTRVAESTVIGRVQAILAAAQGDKPLISRRIDLFLKYYTPAVLMLSGMTWILTQSLDRAVSVLVVSLPCAFLLAGPSVIVASLAVCARLGILVKSPRFFEVASTIDAAVFDKTGTLTEGRLAVLSVDWVVPLGVAGGAALAPPEWLPVLAGSSQHPVAQAVASELGRLGGGQREGRLAGPVLDDLREVPGRGLGARWRGQVVLLGSAAWLSENGLHPPEMTENADVRVVFAAAGGAISAIFFLQDTLREEAPEVVRQLAGFGVSETHLLTGDHAAAAARVAGQCALTSWRANCLPEEKRAAVLALREGGRGVMVVGDGVNDAPALAAGHLSVAISHSGSHLAVQTADVALLNGNLWRLIDFTSVSRRALRLINQNLVLAVIFIAVSLVMTFLGWIGPLTSALLHEISTVLVIANSARLLRYEPREGAALVLSKAGVVGALTVVSAPTAG